MTLYFSGLLGDKSWSWSLLGHGHYYHGHGGSCCGHACARYSTKRCQHASTRGPPFNIRQLEAAAVDLMLETVSVILVVDRFSLSSVTRPPAQRQPASQPAKPPANRSKDRAAPHYRPQQRHSFVWPASYAQYVVSTDGSRTTMTEQIVALQENGYAEIAAGMTTVMRVKGRYR